MTDHESGYLKFVSASFPTTWARNDLMVRMCPPYTPINVANAAVIDDLSGSVALGASRYY